MTPKQFLRQFRGLRLADVTENSAESFDFFLFSLRKILIYRSFERSMKIIRKNFLAFFALTLLLQSPMFLYEFYQFQNINSGEDFEVLSFIMSISIEFLIFFINVSVLVYGTGCELTDCHASFSKCVIQGLKHASSAIGVILVITSAWLTGLVFLIIPAFIIITILWVAIPEAIVEGTKILESLKRSVYLTKGYRLQIFVTILMLLIVRFQSEIISDHQNDYPFLISLIGFLVGSFIVLILGVLCTVFYHDIRIIKEGPAQERAQQRIARRLQTGGGLPPISSR